MTAVNGCQWFCYICVCLFPRTLRCTTYSSVWQEEGFILCGGFSSFFPPFPSLPSTVYQCDGCLSSWGCLWLVCQVLSTIGAVSILELAANCGSSGMSRAPNLQLQCSKAVVTLYGFLPETPSFLKRCLKPLPNHFL